MRSVSTKHLALDLQARSQVGCRLMVASMAKIRRPRSPLLGRAGGMERTCARKASTSSCLAGGCAAAGCTGALVFGPVIRLKIIAESLIQSAFGLPEQGLGRRLPGNDGALEPAAPGRARCRRSQRQAVPSGCQMPGSAMQSASAGSATQVPRDHGSATQSCQSHATRSASGKKRCKAPATAWRSSGSKPIRRGRRRR